MTVAGAITRPFSPIARWIMRRLWWVEHAFERARASDKAVDDTRLRIFFVLALFAAGFVTLALGAGKAALFSPYARVAEPITLMPGARAELVDRNGAVLALDLPRYGLYVDPTEMLHKDAVRAALLQALPAIEAAKLNAILAGKRREYLLGQLTAAQQTQVHDLGLPGVSFEEESGRDYPLDTIAAHVIGFTSKDGVGLAGAEKAFDKAMRADMVRFSSRGNSVALPTNRDSFQGPEIQQQKNKGQRDNHGLGQQPQGEKDQRKPEITAAVFPRKPHVAQQRQQGKKSA